MYLRGHSEHPLYSGSCPVPRRILFYVCKHALDKIHVVDWCSPCISGENIVNLDIGNPTTSDQPSIHQRQWNILRKDEKLT